MKFFFLLSALFLFASSAPVCEAEESEFALKIEAKVAFTEGPAEDPRETGAIFFTDIVNNRIMRRDPSGSLDVFRTPSGRANGLVFDSEGRLHACEGGNRWVTRTEADGSITILTDEFEGGKYNSPNDLILAGDGSLYFTDPQYGDRSTMEQFDKDGKAIEGVYRVDSSGKVSRIIEHEVDRPNGLGISSDGKYLVVADNVNNGPNDGVGGNRMLWRFNLNNDGSVDLESRKLLFDWGTERGPDGMAVGPDGLFYVTAGYNYPNPPAETSDLYKAGVYCISIEGELKRFIPVPADMITNCTFGGKDGKTLFITAGHKLWSIEIE